MLIFVAMANKLKSKKSQAPDPEKLKAETEEQLPVKDLVKDERTHKILGAILILLAFFLFVAFVSYLFTWEKDQSVARSGIAAFHQSADKAANLLGNLGAVVSDFFFYYAFGLASFALCSLFFVAGANLLFARKLFSVRRNVKYVLVALVFFSVAFSFVTMGNPGFPWGGAFGNYVNGFLVQTLGKIGTGALLAAGALSYIIWRFNPIFHVPKLPKRTNKAADLPEPVAVEEEAKLFVEEPVMNGKKKKNGLKGEGNLPLTPVNTENDPEIDFQLVEKNIPEEAPAPEISPYAPVPVEEKVLPRSRQEGENRWSCLRWK